MKYIRVVFAVKDEDVQKFRIAEEIFVEEEVTIQGCYQSKPYDDRETALRSEGFESITQDDLK